eukprot:TRINITY_DN801_c0_g1_i1.p1 TRINITY_DN801_c0_g1~~TRINITY_DN801_c0_g1_i1.p1  ORF type:complete len:984 (+),score=276.85 TRINITY_DN801_c0_g1_i1:246-2954(+)
MKVKASTNAEKESRQQAHWVAIANGLKEGVDDLLTGRVFRPSAKDSDDDRADSLPSSELWDIEESSASEGVPEKVVSLEVPRGPPNQVHMMAGLPTWLRRQSTFERAQKSLKDESSPVRAQGETEGSDKEQEATSEKDAASEAEAGRGSESEESVSSFLNFHPHDINDLVCEVDEGKKAEQVRLGKAELARLKKTPNTSRVQVMEELNNFFQKSRAAAAREMEDLSKMEEESASNLAEQSASARQLRHQIERKEVHFFSRVSSYHRNMSRRFDEHWRHKKELQDKLEEGEIYKQEQRDRQRRLRESQSSSARRVGELEAESEKLKEEIREAKRELKSDDSEKKKIQVSGSNKTTQVLSVLSMQQDETQALQGKLALQQAKLQAWERALELAKLDPDARRKKQRQSQGVVRDPADDLLEEVAYLCKVELLGEHMNLDSNLSELVWLAISIGEHGGSRKGKPGFVKLSELSQELEELLKAEEEDFFSAPAGGGQREESRALQAGEDDSEERQQLQAYDQEAKDLQEEIDALQALIKDPDRQERRANQQASQSTGGEDNTKASQPVGSDENNEAYKSLLDAATRAHGMFFEKKEQLLHQSAAGPREKLTQGDDRVEDVPEAAAEEEKEEDEEAVAGEGDPVQPAADFLKPQAKTVKDYGDMLEQVEELKYEATDLSVEENELRNKVMRMKAERLKHKEVEDRLQKKQSAADFAMKRAQNTNAGAVEVPRSSTSSAASSSFSTTNDGAVNAEDLPQQIHVSEENPSRAHNQREARRHRGQGGDQRSDPQGRESVEVSANVANVTGADVANVTGVSTGPDHLCRSSEEETGLAKEELEQELAQTLKANAVAQDSVSALQRKLESLRRKTHHEPRAREKREDTGVKAEIKDQTPKVERASRSLPMLPM